MWQQAYITVDGSGAGNVNLIPKANLPFSNEGAPSLYLKTYIPAQAGFVSGASDVTVSEIMPDSRLVSDIVLANATTPTRKIPQNLVYDATGTVTTSYAYEVVTGLNVAVASANANAVVSVWVLFAPL